MATTDTLAQPHDRSDRAGRRRPFSTWVKKLTNFKGGSSATEGGDRSAAESKRAHIKIATKSKKRGKKNNPYPQSGTVGPDHGNDDAENNSSHSFTTARSGSATSLERGPPAPSDDGNPPHTAGGSRSLAPTVATDNDGHHYTAPPSHGASSVAGTSRTVGGLESRRGGDSTFSSPAPSVRSLTTTLTTIQSSMGAPANAGHQQQSTANSTAPNGTGTAHANHQQAQSIQFHQPFPTASPASAIPAHLAPTSSNHHPTTYSSATANNLLTDNASVLTLASSSKRRRRRSIDTDASVRALAPSSVWGGSRESLPLSVLSANVDHQGGLPQNTTAGLHQSSGAGASAAGGSMNPRSNVTGTGTASAERTSIYSATGVAPALPGDRNSFYAKRQAGAGDVAGDGASTRSGLLGHGRADSISGSIGGISSPLIPANRGDKTGVEEQDETEEAEPGKDSSQ